MSFRGVPGVERTGPTKLIAVAAHQFFTPLLATGQWRVSLVLSTP